MKDRFQIIGASEIAGIIKEYSANLFAENLISETINEKLQAMPNYLETRYSLGKKLMLTREQFKRFPDCLLTTNNAFPNLLFCSFVKLISPSLVSPNSVINSL